MEVRKETTLDDSTLETLNELAGEFELPTFNRISIVLHKKIGFQLRYDLRYGNLMITLGVIFVSIYFGTSECFKWSGIDYWNEWR